MKSVGLLSDTVYFEAMVILEDGQTDLWRSVVLLLRCIPLITQWPKTPGPAIVVEEAI